MAAITLLSVLPPLESSTRRLIIFAFGAIPRNVYIALPPELEDFLRGSFLETAPIVPVSCKTGAGLRELKQALVEQARQVAGKDAQRDFRLPIDRAFTLLP